MASWSNCLIYAAKRLRAAWREGRGIGLWIRPTGFNRWRWLRWPHVAVINHVDPSDCEHFAPLGPKRRRRFPPVLFKGETKKGIG